MGSTTFKASVVRTLAAWTLVLGTSSLPANAEPHDRVTFREFRQQNEGIDRNAARRMFHQQFGRQSTNNPLQQVNQFQNVVTVGPDGQVVCGGGNIDQHQRIREPRIRNISVQELSNGALARVNRGVDLDLSSADKNIVLGRSLFDAADGGSVEINVGGKTSIVQAGSTVTAAEYVAVKQALNGGQQVQIDRSGRATGGSIDLGSLTAGNDVMRASSLVIPENVTTSGDFGRGSDFRLTGALSNFGTVQVLSSDRAIRGGSIRANDISNHSGALISSTVDLRLDADRNLTNYGDILSTESLSLSAGGQLTNAGRIASNGDLNLNSSSITNRGVMSSSSANVNLASPSDLSVNNYRGTISAVNGAINVRDAAYAGANNSYINGGDLFSRELNLNSGLGSANVNVNQLTGVVNSTGTASHVLASTDTLNVGNNCLTGDPTFYNTAGGIQIAGNIIVQEDLVFAAYGAISSVDNITIQAGDANKGYNITFISGASLTAVGGTSQPNVGPVTGSPPYPNSGAVTISNKAGKSGGGINLGSNVLVSSRSTDTSSNRNGGNISLFAFGKSSLIDLGGTKLESGGQKLGTNGDIVVATGGTSTKTQAGITLAGVDTTNQTGGAQGAGGKLTVVTAVPVVVNGKTVTYDDKGALQGLSFFAPGTKLTKGDVIFAKNGAITAGTDINVAGALDVQSGRSFNVENAVTAPTATFYSAAFQQTFNGGSVKANSVVLTTGKGGFIGTGPDDGMVINTNALTIQSPGGFGSIVGTGTGVLTLNSVGNNFLAVDSPAQDIQGSASATSYLLLRGGSLNPTGTVSSGNTLVLVSGNPLTNTDISQYAADYLILSSNQVGTDQNNPFQVNSAVKQVDVLSLGDAFVKANAAKSIVLGNVDVTGDLHFKSNTGITLGIGTNTVLRSTGGLLDIGTTNGVLSVAKNVNISAVDGISLINSGTATKDKLTFGANSTLTNSNGGITVGLGTPGADTTPSFTNPTLNATNGGTITFKGIGNVLTAKGAQSQINANKAGVLIYNSVSAKNLTLGGNNQINASTP